MSDTVVVKFANGNVVRFGSRESGGLNEVGLLGDASAKAGEAFEKGMSALADVVGALEQAVGGLAHKPDGVEVEFSASLKGNCDLWVVSGEGEAEFKVTLKWEKADAKGVPG